MLFPNKNRIKYISIFIIGLKSEILLEVNILKYNLDAFLMCTHQAISKILVNNILLQSAHNQYLRVSGNNADFSLRF